MATAATVYLHQDAEMLSEKMSEMLRKQRAEAIKKPLTAVDIMKLEMAAHSGVEGANEGLALSRPPTPVGPVPHWTGPHQYLPGTVDIPEASYEDVLHFIALNKAMKDGDVGLMEKLLPTLLFRFIGGGNGKYAVEVLELMQGLY
ncbi:hypothetical protein FA13DRAFT_1805896 [Coprinellus micaceus]|uniref:DUF6589 domain-containing protein n=1 Tax=Coprinellus micaceus TaxID=71717 RepID=A0A4Y7RV36_COPMI|nr:hypothetical protein FA13DRAFT_1805896 [Coprinellus micaceus]